MSNNLLLRILFKVNWLLTWCNGYHIHLAFPNGGGINQEAVSCIHCGLDKYPKNYPAPSIVFTGDMYNQ